MHARKPVRRHHVLVALAIVGTAGPGATAWASAPPDTAPGPDEVAAAFEDQLAADGVAALATKCSPPDALGAYACTATIAGGGSVTATAIVMDGELEFDSGTAGMPGTEFGAGSHEVGVDVEPGRYVARDVDGCYWQRVDDVIDGEIIANDFIESGSAIVDILASDAGFVADNGCGSWTRYEPGGTGQLDHFGNGRFVVADDIVPGVYEARPVGDRTCRWDRLAAFSGSLDDARGSGLGRGRTVVEIVATDIGFASEECSQWTPYTGPSTTTPVETFGPGTWTVGDEIAPGRYVAVGTDDEGLGLRCRWERVASFTGSLDDSLGRSESMGSGPLLIDIDAGDFAVRVGECPEFTPYVAPAAPATSFGPGDHVVGEDIEPGTYAADGDAESCYWARLESFDGGFGSIIDNAFGEGLEVEIEAGDVGFSASAACGTWTLDDGLA